MKNKRTVNKKLIMAVMAYSGHNLSALGNVCDPPVSSAAICMMISGKCLTPRLIDQASKIFDPAEVEQLAKDIHELRHALLDNDPAKVLFPYKEGADG